MNNHVSGVRGLARIAVVGVALALSSAQVVAADSLRPTMDAGGSGGLGASSQVVSVESAQATGGYYAIVDEYGNASVPERAVALSQQGRIMTCPPCATVA